MSSLWPGIVLLWGVPPRLRRTQAQAKRLLLPLVGAKPSSSGWRVVSWDAEQGISLVFGRGDRFILIEAEARDDSLDCYAKTRRFNVCARSQFTPDGSLTDGERKLVDGVVRYLARQELSLSIASGPTPDRPQVREIEVDRMLIPEGAGRYYLNPYAGCMIGCTFCYVEPRADFSRRLDGEAPPRWGRWVDVKVNAAEVLAREVEQHPPGLVRLSPILTDPYQGVETRYRVTRACLEVLSEAGFPFLILTRESRVLEDLELFKQGAVGFSIPTDDDAIRQAFEPGADSIEARFEALERFHAAGVATCAVVQPALPMDEDAFVERCAPLVRAVRIDAMHFEQRVAEVLTGLGIDPAGEREAGVERVRRLKERFEARGVKVDHNDDLTGIIEGWFRTAL